jgi:hypothetical protein
MADEPLLPHDDDPWGHDVNSNLQFLRRGYHDNCRMILENTEITKHLAIKIDGMDNKIDELRPLITGMRVARKGGKWATAIAVFSTRAAQVGAFFVGLGMLGLALFHGEKFSEAWVAFWNTLK